MLRKKSLNLIFTAAFVLGLSACGDSKNSGNSDSPANHNGAPTPPAETSTGAKNKAPQYYQGVENKPLEGKVADCYVEVSFSEDLLRVTVRAIMVHPHRPPGSIIGLGPTEALYNASGFYRYQDADNKAPIKDLVLRISAAEVPEKYSVSFLHGNHHDPAHCEQLQPADVSSQFEVFPTFNPED